MNELNKAGEVLEVKPKKIKLRKKRSNKIRNISLVIIFLALLVYVIIEFNLIGGF